MSRVTAAERAAIDAIAKHGTIKAAAFALGKSRYTVEAQLETARKRLGVDTTVQLVSAVYRKNGNTEPPA